MDKYTPMGYIMDSERRKILGRLRRIEGQIRGLQRMIEAQAPCVEVLTQVSAVTAAMKKTGNAIIRANLSRCMAESAGGNGQGMDDFQAALKRYIDLS
ncbi:MAG: Copper-sensing transcriptional repressor CsoR [Syntrophaceae bacterium PtaB.Bin038]|jgi:DNA-binding FrmR family transcriptional regulator|nr:MAG: Copper-sensing transcriptional repressor CsoR [Syntrophaceae bacterium PtaB.Bin038]